MSLPPYLPPVEFWGYVIAATGGVVGVAAVAALIVRMVKKVLRATDLWDRIVEAVNQVAGRPATRDDPGQPGLMDRMMSLEHKLDVLGAVVAEHLDLEHPEQRRTGRRQDNGGRRRRPSI